MKKNKKKKNEEVKEKERGKDNTGFAWKGGFFFCTTVTMIRGFFFFNRVSRLSLSFAR